MLLHRLDAVQDQVNSAFLDLFILLVDPVGDGDDFVVRQLQEQKTDVRRAEFLAGSIERHAVPGLPADLCLGDLHRSHVHGHILLLLEIFQILLE